MEITVNYSEDNDFSLKVMSAEYVAGYIISVVFSDGSSKHVDFQSFLENAMHYSVRKYLDKDKFMNFDIVDGNINWNDYDMIFPVWDLYLGRIAG